MFSNHLENFLPISSNLKSSSANSPSFKGSKIRRLGKDQDEMLIKSEEILVITKFYKYCYFNQRMFIMLSGFKGFSGGGELLLGRALLLGEIQ